MNKDSKFKTITIENVKKEDLKACAIISVTSWQETYQNIIDKEYLNNLSIEKRLEKFQENYQSTPFLVAKINNEVVGFCRYNTLKNPKFPFIDCELTVLYVKPELKNQGIGTSLLKETIKKLQKENKHNMLICCLKDNQIGKKFYQKMGGKIIGENIFEIDNKSYPELAFHFKI